MYLFTRSLRLGQGHLREAMGWSANVTDKVNQITELDVSLWTSAYSPGLGTLVWTSMVESLAVLETSEAKLMADDGYLSVVEEGAKFDSGQAIDDNLLQLVFADPDGANTQPQYATVVQAVLALGSMTRGIELGVEIAQRVKKTTGRPTSFGVTATGTYGGVEWISVHDSIEQLQAAEEALSADTVFAKLLDAEASKAYQPGATQMVYRRIT
jgi:hypothetical protein